MSKTVGLIEMFMGPRDVDASLDDLGAAIIDFNSGQGR